MKVVSIINYKGGVGKTTITTNLASDLTKRGKRVLVIDLDPQTNLTFSFLKVEEWKKSYENEKTIKYWFDSIIDGTKPVPSFKDLIVKKSDLDIICSHLGLIDVDIELAAGLSAGTERQHKNNFIKTYSYIKNELNDIKEDYDVVLIDCPPNFSIVTKNALLASDYFIVPAKMDYLSTLGINQLRKHVASLVKQYNEYCKDTGNNTVNPEMLGVVATMISVRGGQPIEVQKYYLDALKRSNISLFDSMIRENKSIYSSAPESGTPVVLMSHKFGTYAEVINELKELTTEFIRKAGV
ncbi:MAG: AAA family ATPase [Clostridium sp.]|nr:AAA family ATPase [Clostridium sp.]MDU7083825.1 AAA family ATPase [Clostridium sp.]